MADEILGSGWTGCSTRSASTTTTCSRRTSTRVCLLHSLLRSRVGRSVGLTGGCVTTRRHQGARARRRGVPGPHGVDQEEHSDDGEGASLYPLVSLSPCLLVSLSPCLLVSLSPCLLACFLARVVYTMGMLMLVLTVSCRACRWASSARTARSRTTRRSTGTSRAPRSP